MSGPASVAADRLLVENSIEILVDKDDWSIDEAKRVIRETIEERVEGDFCSAIPSPPPPADVYATERFSFWLLHQVRARRRSAHGVLVSPATGPCRQEGRSGTWHSITDAYVPPVTPRCRLSTETGRARRAIRGVTIEFQRPRIRRAAGIAGATVIGNVNWNR